MAGQPGGEFLYLQQITCIAVFSQSEEQELEETFSQNIPSCGIS